jgi:hypothetical protein
MVSKRHQVASCTAVIQKQPCCDIHCADGDRIETLLEEAFNERMHLLTFMKMAEPGWFMRVMVLGAQGVFFNGFFLSYLISPRICHRFVGYLEEEAVITYTRAIDEIEKGELPAWSNLDAPEIAVQYWKMPEVSGRSGT